MSTPLASGQTLRCPHCGSGDGVVRPRVPALRITSGFSKFAVLPLTELYGADLVKCSRCSKVETVDDWRN